MRHPVFIAGTTSSGSHLLATMLDMHPEVIIGPELQIFYNQFVFTEWPVASSRILNAFRVSHSIPWKVARKLFPYPLKIPRLGHANNILRGYKGYGLNRGQLLTMLNQADSLKSFTDSLVTHFEHFRNKPDAIWGEKSLSNIFCFEEFRKIYPDLKIIIMARDGRDSSSSAIKRGAEPLHAFGMWLLRMSACIRALESEVPTLLLRYEDLTSDPETAIRKACDFLEIEFRENLLHPDQNEYWRTQSFHKTWGQSPTSGKISTKSVGQYKKRLTAEQISLFWHTRLTPLGLAMFNGSYDNPAEVMSALGYGEENKSESSVPFKLDVSTRDTAQALAEGWLAINHHGMEQA